jgi:hypothetical protein
MPCGINNELAKKTVHLLEKSMKSNEIKAKLNLDLDGIAREFILNFLIEYYPSGTSINGQDYLELLERLSIVLKDLHQRIIVTSE